MDNSIFESAPPGKKAEGFIKHHKKEFKKRYGDRWQQMLYAVAWKNFGKIDEERLDELTPSKSILNPLKNDLDDLTKKQPERTTDPTRNFQRQLMQVNALGSFVDSLYKLGFKKISYGMYGVVFTHRNINYVIKLFRKDDGYLSFVNLCQTVSNTHFPDFRGKVTAIGDSAYFVRMETLEDMEREQYKVFEAAMDYRKMVVVDDQKMSFLDYAENWGDNIKMDIVKKNLGLPDAIEIVVKRAEANVNIMTLDLHRANIMLRGDVIVITDPYAGH